MRHPRQQPNRDGFSLLTVLLIVLAIGAILIPVAARIKTDTLHAAALLRVDQLSVLAEGVATILVTQRLSNRSAIDDTTISEDSSLYRCHAESIQIEFALQNHAGLINLNLAPKKLLETGFRSLGFDNDQARRLAESAVAFRSYKQDDIGIDGLEIVGSAKNAPFETVAELFDIRSLRKIPLRQLGSTFTVHSQISDVIYRYAPRAVRSADSASDSVPDANKSSGSGFPLTASVRITDGGFAGQFSAVYQPEFGKTARILETWKDDREARYSNIIDEGICAFRFGPEFITLVGNLG